MKFILHKLKTLDFLGPTVNFTIKNETKFKTVFGGVLSFLIYFFYLFFCVLFGQDLIYRLNPNVSLEKIIPEELENYTFTNESFFAWRVTDYGLKNFNSSEFFDIHLSFEVYDNLKMEVTQWKAFDSISCKNSQYEKFFEDSIYKAEDWNCFDFGQLQGLKMSGSWDTSEFGSILFQMQICDIDYENSLKNNCKDYKKVQKYLNDNSLFITFLYYEVDFKANNYLAPLQKIFKTTFTNLNLNLQKTDYLKLQNTKVEQDDQIMFSEERQLTNMHGIYPSERLTFFRSNEDLEIIYSTNVLKAEQNVYSLFILYDIAYHKYSRKYQKIQDVFGNVNGFMEFFIAVISVVSLYTDYRLEFYLFNKLVKVHRATNEYNIYNNYNKTNNNNNDKNFDINRKNNFLGNISRNLNNEGSLHQNLSLNNNYNNNLEIVNELKCPDIKTQIDAMNQKNFSKVYGINNSNEKISKSFTHSKKPSALMVKDNSCLRFTSDKVIDNGIEKNDLAIQKEKYDSGYDTPIKPLVLSMNGKDNELDKIDHDVMEINLKNNADANSMCFNNQKKDLNTDRNNKINYFDRLNDNNENAIYTANKSEQDNKEEKDVLRNIDLLFAKKKRYLKPSFFNYFVILCCKLFHLYKKKSKDLKTKKYFDFKLLDFYNDKINKKFDIFYYLKWIRNYKNLKKLVLENKTNEKAFDVLSMNFYAVKIGDSWDFSVLKKKKKDKNKKKNKETLRNNFEGIFESNDLKFKQFLFNRLKEY